MKLILTVVLAMLLAVFMPSASLAQSSGGKSGGDVAALDGSLGGGKGGPNVTEEVAVGSDADQAVEELGSPVDPTGDPASWFDTLVTWWKAGWFLPFGFLVALGVVTYAARYLPWLGATPKRALLVSAVTAFLVDVVTRLGTGAPLTVPILVAAVGVAINTYMNGGKAADRAADGKAAKFGPA